MAKLSFVLTGQYGACYILIPSVSVTRKGGSRDYQKVNAKVQKIKPMQEKSSNCLWTEVSRIRSFILLHAHRQCQFGRATIWAVSQ